MVKSAPTRPVRVECRRVERNRVYDARVPRDHFRCARCGQQVVTNLDPDHTVTARKS